MGTKLFWFFGRRFQETAGNEGAAGGTGAAPAANGNSNGNASLLDGAIAGGAGQKKEGETSQASAAAVAEWFWAEGVKGADKAPDWFDGKKYKTVAEQAKAYPELATKFGEMSTKLKGFAGAPEAYELSMPDDLKEAVSWSSNDPLLTDFQKFAKEKGMDQETFTGLLHMLAKYEYSQEAVDLEAEKKELGNGANERIKGFADWARANLSEEQFSDVLGAMSQRSRPSQVFRAIETILQASRQDGVMPRVGDDVRSGSTTQEEWHAKWYAKSEVPGHQYKIDEPGMRKQAREELAGIVGTGQHMQVVGKR